MAYSGAAGAAATQTGVLVQRVAGTKQDGNNMKIGGNAQTGYVSTASILLKLLTLIDLLSS